MMFQLQKTSARTGRFLIDALTWRASGRQNGIVAWSLIGGLVWLVANAFADPDWPRTLGMGLYLLLVLAAICAIDARFGIIPDSLNLALAVGGIVEHALFNEFEQFGGGVEAVAVLLAGVAFQAGYRKLRGYDGLGFGDVKFIAASTFWIGLAGLPQAILIAVGSALVALFVLKAERCEIGGRRAIPFGPHLAVGAWLTWTIGPLQLPYSIS